MSTVNWSLQAYTDTAANLAARATPILEGQLAIETDNITTTPKFKIGDGVSLYSALPYFYGAATKTGSGALVFGTSPTFTTDITTPLIIGGTAVGSTIQYKGTTGNGTSTVAAHQFLVGNNGATTAAQIFNSGQVSIGNYASPAAQRLVTIGQDTAYMSFGSLVGLTSVPAIYFNASTPTATNYNIASDNDSFLINANANIGLRIANSNKISFDASTINFTPSASSSGGGTFTFTKPNNTGQTSGSSVNGFVYNSGSRSWNNSGTTVLSTQIENVWNQATYLNGGTGSFTITEGIGNAFYSPVISGGNITLTNTFAGAFYSGSSSLKIGNLTGSSTNIGIYANATTPSNSNYSLVLNSSNVLINSPSGSGSVFIQSGSVNRFSVTGLTTTGSSTSFTFTTPANTGQTASTEIPNFKITGASKTWLAGAITTQRWNYFTANTAAFASASTITYSYGFYAEKAVAGSNATITYNIGIGTDGDLLSAGNYHWQGTSTPTTTNYTSYKDAATAIFNGGDNVALSNNGTTYLDIRRGGYTSGTRSGFTFSHGNNTGQTASTEISGYLYNSYSRQWATGAITTQREHYLKTVTYSFVGASTITNAYGLYVEAATAGTNATITNNFAAGFSGNINIIGTPYVSGVAGVDGTFTTADAKTVTVTKGIITSIV